MRAATAMSPILVSDCPTVNATTPGKAAVTTLPTGSSKKARRNGRRRPNRSAKIPNSTPSSEAARTIEKIHSMPPRERSSVSRAKGSVSGKTLPANVNTNAVSDMRNTARRSRSVNDPITPAFRVTMETPC